MERVFIGLNRAEATREADDWRRRQKGLRTNTAHGSGVGEKGPDLVQTERWAVTIRFEYEK